MRHNKAVISFLVLFLISQGCGQVRTVTQLAGLATQIVKLLRECNELSKSFSVKVAEVTNVMEGGIRENKDALTLGKYWEKYWSNIHSEYAKLYNKLEVTDQLSQEYFIELAINNSLISNEELKAEDAKQNLELKEKYQQEYINALNSLSEAQRLLKDGDDVMYMLRNKVLRANVEENISVLKSISVQANMMTKSISSFSNTCMPIFSMNQ